MADPRRLVVALEDLGRGDTPLVGGKNASLGEMISRLASRGVRVPGGFATTAEAYWAFIEANELTRIIHELPTRATPGRG